MLRRLRNEAAETLRRPSRVRNLLDRQSISTFMNRMLAPESERRLAAPWQTLPDTSFSSRHYRSYADYVNHQRSKLRTKNLVAYDARFRDVLRDRLGEKGSPLQPGMSVLCLGARIGTEVKAFHDLNCYAVGIDLNPGPANRWVLPGDFHNLQFPDSCVDVVFTNSIDHALDINRMTLEILRVLKPGGLFITEIVDPTRNREGYYQGYYESLTWRSLDDLIDYFVGQGLELCRHESIEQPWHGAHVCFSATGEPAAASHVW